MTSHTLLRGSISALGLAIAIAVTAPVFAQDNAAAFKEAYRWDKMRRLVGTIRPSASGSTGPYLASRTTYDANGAVIKVEHGELSNWQTEAIDPANWTGFTVRQTLVTDYDDFSRKKREYILGSNLVITSLTQYNYDLAGRLQCTAIRMNPTAFFAQPDACAQSVPTSPTPDRITYNAYDAAGQLIQVRSGVGTSLEQPSVTYSYTTNGNLEFVVDANGNRSKAVYDGFDRQAKSVFPSEVRPGHFVPGAQATVLASAGALNEADYEEYSYDANGNRTHLRKRDGSVITYQYDALNRVTAKWMPSSSSLAARYRRNTYYFYDLRGIVTAARFDHPDGSGEGVSASYDTFGQIVSSTLNMNGVSRTLAFEYDANGNRTKVTHPDGVYFRSAHDGLDRLGTSWWGGPGWEGQFATVGYNAIGQRTGSHHGGSSTTYGYNTDQQLSHLWQNFANGTGDDAQTFSYNSANQVLQETRTNPLYGFSARYNVDRAYDANGLNQYTATHSTTNTTTNTTLCHDPNGNLIADGTYVYLYDIENRLVEKRLGATVSCAAVNYSGAIQAQLRYDPLGRLYETVGATGTTRMLYDGDRLTAEYNEYGVLLRRYFWGDRTDEPILWSEGSSFTCDGGMIQFLHTDRLGSVTASADCWGNFKRAWRYDEYGIPQASDGAPLRPDQGARFLYTGQVFLHDVGLYYYKARMYSPTLGRFLQTDPIGYADGPNLYNYVNADPVNFRDPSGMMTCMIMKDGHWVDDDSPECKEKYDIVVVGRPSLVWEEGYHAFYHEYGYSSGQIGAYLPNKGLLDYGKDLLCGLPALNPGVGADLYAGLGGSLGGGLNIDIARGQFGLTGSLAVGLGLGVDVGPGVSAGPSGSSVVSANLAVGAGFALPVGPGVNVGGSAGYNVVGTDPGFSGGAIGRFGTPLGYVNGGANFGFNTSPIYDLGCNKK